MRVLGVDACRSGWAVVALEGRGPSEIWVTGDFAPLLGDSADVVAVDMPIGLPPPYPRPADRAARALLGKRASTVFPTPPREVLEAPDHATAVGVARDVIGRGVSRQAYALGPRILEVDALADDRRIVEAHPEVSFATMAGRPLPPKRTPDGQAARTELLTRLGIELPAVPRPGAALHDLLDAAAVAWTALRYAGRRALPLPERPPRDVRGRPVAIWR